MDTSFWGGLGLETVAPPGGGAGWLDAIWDDEWLAIGAGEHGVGFAIVDEGLAGGVDGEFSAESIGDVAEVAECA